MSFLEGDKNDEEDSKEDVADIAVQIIGRWDCLVRPHAKEVQVTLVLVLIVKEGLLPDEVLACRDEIEYAYYHHYLP